MLSHKNEVQPVANGIRQRIKIDYSSVTFVDPGVQIDKTWLDSFTNVAACYTQGFW